jgi:ubiquinone/menaquinone biosynthesis C-methylase UbiE
METARVAGIFARAAPTYCTVGQDFFGFYGRRLVAMIGPPLGRSVLDLACGRGATLLAASDLADEGALVVGADLSRDMLVHAHAALAERGRPAATALADARRIPFRDGAFDTATSSFALGYFPSPHDVAAEVHRVLKPGGRVGICASDGWWFQGDPDWSWHEELLDELGAAQASGPFQDPEAVAGLLREAAFHVDEQVVEHFELRWDDVDEWWDWGWSHGYRAVLEALTPSALAEYRRRSYERLGRGPARGQLEVVLVTGTADDPR